jgi:hypothetical protein
VIQLLLRLLRLSYPISSSPAAGSGYFFQSKDGRQKSLPLTSSASESLSLSASEIVTKERCVTVRGNIATALGFACVDQTMLPVLTHCKIAVQPNVQREVLFFVSLTLTFLPLPTLYLRQRQVEEFSLANK